MENGMMSKGGAFALVLIMLVAGLLGAIMALPPTLGLPGDNKGDPIDDDGLITDLAAVMDYAYNTSDQKINVSWDFPEMWAPEVVFTDLFVNLKNTFLGIDLELLSWNGTVNASPLPDYCIWSLPENLTARADFRIVVRFVIYSNVAEEYYGDEDTIFFPILDGTVFIQAMTALPAVVDNSGTSVVNLSFSFNRSYSELSFDDFEVSLYHVDAIPPFEIELTPPAPEDKIEGDHNVTLWTHFTVPGTAPVGEYRLYMLAADVYGYNQSSDQHILTVVWKEMPPALTNGTVYMHEDSFVNIDLNDHITDVNGQELNFYVDPAQFENLALAWMSDDKVNITSAPDWNGAETFTVWANDSVGNNVSLEIEVNVMPVPDELIPSPIDGRTVTVQEDIGSADFDPTGFFYDPDAPVTIVVSLGWAWAKNATNVSVAQPIWTWDDGNFSVLINSTTTTVGQVTMIADLEEGSVDVPITAWLAGEPVLNSTMVVEIAPVNDVPEPISGTLTILRNQVLVWDLRELFVDPDGPEDGKNFTVDTSMTSTNVTIVYDNITFELTVTPATNWTGTTTFVVNATDGVDFKVHNMTVSVVLPTYKVSGTVTFQDNAQHLANVSVDNLVATLTFGTQSVSTDNVTFSYEILLPEGTYTVTVSLNLPSEKYYDATAKRSGYMVPVLDDIVLSSETTLNIVVAWKEHIDENKANWTELDFENVQFNELDDGGWEVVLPVKDAEASGYSELTVYLVIRNKGGKDTENNEVLMVWNATSKEFSVIVDEDLLDNVTEGKVEYYFRDGLGNKSPVEKFEFKSKDEGAGIITVIVLIVLIILVLIALVFIMRKPSEEEEEEPESSEEEGPESRTCPGCNESITDADATDCPYCGETLEEE